MSRFKASKFYTDTYLVYSQPESWAPVAFFSFYDLPCHRLHFSEGMDIDRLDGACHLATEARPAVSRILDLGLVRVIHHDNIPWTELGTEPTPNTDVSINFTNHPRTS